VDEIGKTGVFIAGRAIAVPLMAKLETEIDPGPSQEENPRQGSQPGEPAQEGMLAQDQSTGEATGSQERYQGLEEEGVPIEDEDGILFQEISHLALSPVYRREPVFGSVALRDPANTTGDRGVFHLPEDQSILADRAFQNIHDRARLDLGDNISCNLWRGTDIGSGLPFGDYGFHAGNQVSHPPGAGGAVGFFLDGRHVYEKAFAVPVEGRVKCTSFEFEVIRRRLYQL
jgi:hypothetical protein